MSYYGRSAEDLALRHQTGEPDIGQDGSPMQAQPIIADGASPSRVVGLTFWGRAAEDLALREQTGEPDLDQTGEPELAQPIVIDGKTATEVG